MTDQRQGQKTLQPPATKKDKIRITQIFSGGVVYENIAYKRIVWRIFHVSKRQIIMFFEN